MSRWFRFYEDSLHNPKLLRLSDKLYRFWTHVLCMASQNDGRIPHVEDIAQVLRMRPDAVKKMMEGLINSGLIEEFEKGFKPHDWDERQFKSDTSDKTAAERMQRYRSKGRNTVTDDDRNAPVTPNRNATVTLRPDTDTDTDTDTESKKGEPAPSGAPPDPAAPEKQFFDRSVEILGPRGRSMAGKLLKSVGGNIAIARSKLELSSQKSNPMEWLAACTGPPRAQPVTLKEIKQDRWENARQKLKSYAYGEEGSGDGGGSSLRILPAIGSE